MTPAVVAYCEALARSGAVTPPALPGPPVLPTCCRRHRAVGRADGDCGEVTADDLRALYYVAAEGLVSAHPEDYAEGALHAVRALCETLNDERRALADVRKQLSRAQGELDAYRDAHRGRATP